MKKYGLKFGLIKNFEKLYNKFFLDKFVKENNFIYIKFDINKYVILFDNNNKFGYIYRKKISDGYKIRKMLCDFVEYMYNWNR